MALVQRHLRPEYEITDVVGAAQTIIPDGADDVTTILHASYVVQEETGGGAMAGTASVIPGANAIIYADGVDSVQLQVAANGAVTVQRTAGADTFNVRLHMVYI